MPKNSSAISRIRRSREEATDDDDEDLADESMDEGVPIFMNPNTSLPATFTSVMPAGRFRRTTRQSQVILQARSRKRPRGSAAFFANMGNGDDPEEDADIPRSFFMNQQASDPQLNAEYQRMKRENDDLRAKAAKLEDRLTDLQARAKESYDEQVNKNAKVSKKKR
jgi:hypothetical protein